MSKIGDPMDRVDGRLKVTGAAKYATEFTAPNIAHAVLVHSTIAKGRVTSIDSSAAKNAPGVIAVITHENRPNMKAPAQGGERIALLDPEIYFSGQPIAVVVAETIEQAEHGAELVRVEYTTEKPEIVIDNVMDKAYTAKGRGGPGRGNVETGLAAATVKVEQEYRTPMEHHNPMEPHGTVALWESNDKLKAYDSTQGITSVTHGFTEQFMLKPGDVRVIDPFVGGGFGCKGTQWSQSPLTAMAAKVVNRPVKLSLSRRQMFWSTGHRSETRQSVIYGADNAGKLVAIRHHMLGHTSQNADFVENTTSPASMLYSCPNVELKQRLVKLNIGIPTYMRAPGEASGSFGQETAMDELAIALNIDPIELRLRNYAEKDENANKPWSSKSLRECYKQAAAAFGWSKRNPTPRSMRYGRYLVGYGMATATYPAHFTTCSARARMFANGTVLIQTGSQDLGTGTYTILNQVASECLGVPSDKIRVEIGDSSLPPAPQSGGSVSATSTGSAIKRVCEDLLKTLAVMAGLSEDQVVARDGRLIAGNKSKTYQEILSTAGKQVVEQELKAPQGNPGGGGPTPYSSQGFGAQFCEVHVDADLGMVRIARWVGAFGLGKVMNAKTLTSQLQGGIVWGISMALLEETLADEHYARYLNTNLAEYHVPVNKDIPPIEIIVVPEEDTHVSPIGAKGAGEIGITGAAAAVGNAIYHATGKRIRELPITLDKLL